MVFNLENPIDKISFREYCNKLFLDGGVVEVKKKSPLRSLPQNAYLHVCLGYFASEFGYTIEEVKMEIFKKRVNHEIFSRVRMNRRGQAVRYLRSSKDLDSKEMTDAIERFRNYSSSVAGLYIPAPDEREALFEAQKQISKYELYL